QSSLAAAAWARALPRRWRSARIAGIPRAKERLCDDRPLQLADAERPQDPHHAGGDRAGLPGPWRRYRQGRPVPARIPGDQPEQQDSGPGRPARAGWQADLDLRIWRHADLPRRKMRPAAARDAARSLRDAGMADVPDGRHRADAGP